MRLASIIIAIGLLLPVLAFSAEPPKTGEFKTTFDTRSQTSQIEAMGRRAGWSVRSIEKSGQEQDYNLSKESFEVYVPASCADGAPAGLFVWISSGDSGRVPNPAWKKTLDARRIIWIGLNKAGNERPVWCRMGLAIDAAINMGKRYSLDPDRIYVSGVSGGGRISSMLAICFPDVFRGGLPIVGCNYYRQISSTEQAGRSFRATFTPPPTYLLTVAKTRSRFVLLTGQTDSNREQTKLNSEAMTKDGFKNVAYLEVPGLGHQAPDEQWFQKAIEALDPTNK